MVISGCADTSGTAEGVVTATPNSPSAPRVPAGNERRYGITDLASAKRYGYRVPAEPRRDVPDRASGGPAETSALTGHGRRTVRGRPIPEGGCIGEAGRALGGSPDAGLAQRLSFASYDRSRRDSRVRAVVARWSRCMAARGYDYRGPLDPPADPRFTGKADRGQIRTAVADIGCKDRANVVGVWSAVESAYQRPLIERYRGPLERVRRAEAVRLGNATRVLSN